jgi:hypothetical protein
LERCKPEDEEDEPGWHKLIPEEFQLRILNEMINNIQYDTNTFFPEVDKV